LHPEDYSGCWLALARGVGVERMQVYAGMNLRGLVWVLWGMYKPILPVSMSCPCNVDIQLVSTYNFGHKDSKGAPQPRPARRARALPCACAAPARCYARRRPPHRAVLAGARPYGRSYPRARAFVRSSARGPRARPAHRHVRETQTHI